MEKVDGKDQSFLFSGDLNKDFDFLSEVVKQAVIISAHWLRNA